MDSTYYTILQRDGKTPPDADFSIVIDGDELEPYIHRGGTAYVSRTSRLCDGDVGVFLHSGRIVCRQFCEDSNGTVYLFTVNRRRKKGDITLTRDNRDSVFCFGRLILDNVPLPLE